MILIIINYKTIFRRLCWLNDVDNRRMSNCKLDIENCKLQIEWDADERRFNGFEMPHLPIPWNGTQMNALVRSFLPTGQADKQDIILSCFNKKKRKKIMGMGGNLRLSEKICVLLKISNL